MIFTIPSNKLPFTLQVAIKTYSPQEIRIVARDYSKPNTDYIIRKGWVDGLRTFDLKFPQTPPTMQIFVYNVKNGNQPNNIDKSFSINKFEVMKLKTCPLWTNADVTAFVEFASEFCEDAGILSAGDKEPSIYRSKNGKFCIDYYNKIRNKGTGEVVGTPARVGHASGIIEVSKEDFAKYSVPMRMIILLHEFSHKYMNPLAKREIGDEISADIFALNIYLSLGYPSIEATYAFARVFKSANNDFNAKRLAIITDFISKFVKGQLENHCSTDYAPVKQQEA